MPNERSYDQTRDARTGRPPLPAEAERLKEARRDRPDEIRPPGEEAASPARQDAPQHLNERSDGNETVSDEYDVAAEEEDQEAGKTDPDDFVPGR
jgi:hypothetical protein